MRKPFKPIELSDDCPPVLEAELNPVNGAFKFTVYGKISNLQDYDAKNNAQVLTAYLAMFVFMGLVASPEFSATVNDITNHYGRWFSHKRG